LNDNVVSAVRTRLHQQDEEWYCSGLNDLIPSWRKAIEQHGEFVESQDIN
jgi:hypothetical protein